MGTKNIIMVFFVMALALMAIGTAAAATITVDDDLIQYPDADYTSIKDAVEAPTTFNGDTILVYPGTYNENVDVDKQLNITSTGGAAATNVIAESSDDHVFEVTADWVTINGFNVSGASDYYRAGIYLNSSSNNTLISNTASNNEEGIRLEDSSNNTLIGNTVLNNRLGIILSVSSNNNLTGNTASNTTQHGILLHTSSNNNLTGNTASDNTYHGIYLAYSNNNMLLGNTASNNTQYNLGHGIVLSVSSNNTLIGNKASNNTQHGIGLRYASNNTLTSNTASNNTGHGIYLRNASNSTLINNMASNNTYYGICLEFSSNNTVTDNNASDNNYNGIYLSKSSNNRLISNTASDNTYYGIQLTYSSNNTVTSNKASNSRDGIWLVSSSNNTLNNNNASDNTDYGISLFGSNYNNTLTSNKALNNNYGIYLYALSNNNTLTNNNASDNDVGIYLLTSSNNTLFGNAVCNNTVYGIHLGYLGNDNTIYNNYFNNKNNTQIEDTNTGNVWNTTNSSGPNIIGGPYLGGNYWATPAGNGFSQNNTDTDGNGFCDDPLSEYVFDGNTDYLPLAPYTPGPKTITVDDDGGQDYTTIQAAVDAANPGDTILVYPGTYNENVDVYKQLNITSNDGATTTKVTAASSSDHVFEVTADWATISGFNVSGATDADKAGIWLSSSSNSRLSNNTASNNDYGIVLSPFSNNNTLTDNKASNNNFGISLYRSSNNTLSNNTASNTRRGIYLSTSCNNNTLTSNTALDNTQHGIVLAYSSNNNTLSSNKASNNNFGITLYSSSNNNTLSDNTANSNTWSGIHLNSSSNNNSLSDNTVNSNNWYGIYLQDSGNNTLTSNTMSLNTYNFGAYKVMSNNIDTSNTVDGKPIYYLVDVSDIILDSTSNAGTVYCINCQNISIRDLNLINNVFGICLYNTSNSDVDNITASNTDHGIWLDDSGNNTLRNNTANSNNWYGIRLYSSSNNTLINNTANSNNWYGVGLLESSNNNTLKNNTASANDYGIYLRDTSNNIIYNNYFNNTNNVKFDRTNTGNAWNTTNSSGLNIIGGPYLGGNYWATPTGTGFSQNNVDTNEDGFCDSPLSEYELDMNNIDYLPLADTLTITVTCPVDLEVVDPDGLIINRQTNQIPGAIYEENDINGDGDPDDRILIPAPKRGDYQIEIIPEEDAGATDTYTLEVSKKSTSVVICEDALVSDIPDQPYTVEVITDGDVSSHPVADAGGPYDPVEKGFPITFNASGSYDPDGEIISYEWDFGDEATASGPTPSHEYVEPGVYIVTLTVTDDDDDSDTDVYRYVVVYDSDGGFVTGGGWINSPTGAYVPDPTLVGKANFGFVSEYEKGVDVPTGQTELQFKVADLNFHSDSYDWMIVAGSKAMYKGTGTINGTGNYGFVISAIDAELTPSTNVDLFRIKIWDKDNDVVVYDNNVVEGVNTEDDADPTTEIQGGNIKIHEA